MKFSNYFLIEANKKEKSLIEEDDNFLLGAELEFCTNDIKYVNDIADFIKSKTNIKFYYSKDISVKVEDENDGSIEIQTIPKPWKEFQEEIQEFLNIIQKYGYTNDSCGFHVTINYKDNELPSDFGDKLRLSMQDPKAHKHFPSRKDNEFAKSRTPIHIYYHDKYYNFRIRKGTNQVEFRVIGGKDYEYKWPEIRNLILDFMVKYKKSLLDPEFMKRKLLSSKHDIIKDPKNAYMYAKDVIKGRFPEAEPYIAKDPECALLYSLDVIKNRFHEGEIYIKKSPEYAYLYALHVIKGRFPEAEHYIAKDAKYSYLYATYIIKGRFVEAEPYIAKDPEYSYLYATGIITGRFPDAEPYIAKDAKYSYLYALYVTKGRFIEAEPYIAKNPEYAYLYATDVIKGRFPEAEPYIAKDPEYFNFYKKYVLNTEEK